MMIILCALALLASMVDVRYTLLLILSGYGDEVNPVMRWAVRLGPVATYALALIQTLAACAIACMLIVEYGAIGWALLILLVIVRIGSVIWNWRVWRRA
jgi:hypothetical protein